MTSNAKVNLDNRGILFMKRVRAGSALPYSRINLFSPFRLFKSESGMRACPSYKLQDAIISKVVAKIIFHFNDPHRRRAAILANADAISDERVLALGE
jgi:hypothetical protein